MMAAISLNMGEPGPVAEVVGELLPCYQRCIGGRHGGLPLLETKMR
jgi:hypothetical protein